MTLPSFPTSRLGYDLPQELIAQHPPAVRGESRLIHVNVAAATFSDHSFSELPALLPSQTMLVLNDSRVIPARIEGRRTSGARVELLYHRYRGEGVIEAVVGSNAKLAVGETLLLPGGWRGELLTAKSRDGSQVRLTDELGREPGFEPVLAWLEARGEVPLPPYIKRPDPVGAEQCSAQKRDERNRAEHCSAPTEDADRYQTVYAASAGSVAAPTAGLHFTGALLDELSRGGHMLRQVTLHVGLGTFAPVRVDDLTEHQMHSEEFSVPEGLHVELDAQRSAGKPVIAVGTTSLRVLHSLGRGRAVLGPLLAHAPDSRDIANRAEHCSAPTSETAAFIYPGHGTHAADLLLTNFHLPGSTLLALVYAFGGEMLMRRVYAHAIENRYRFFSYGDCMLIDRRGARLTPDGSVFDGYARKDDSDG